MKFTSLEIHLHATFDQTCPVIISYSRAPTLHQSAAVVTSSTCHISIKIMIAQPKPKLQLK